MASESTKYHYKEKAMKRFRFKENVKASVAVFSVTCMLLTACQTADNDEDTSLSTLDGQTQAQTEQMTTGETAAEPEDATDAVELNGDGYSLDRNGTLTVKNDSVMADKKNAADYPWNLYRPYVKSIVIKEGVTVIAAKAFADCKNATSVEIPDTVTEIGDGAFSLCYALTSVELPDKLQSIGADAFYMCYALTSVSVPSGVTAIADRTFAFCHSLGSVSLSDSVQTLGQEAFKECRALDKVAGCGAVTSVGRFAFVDCESLSRIAFSNSLSKIEHSAFKGCSSLETARLGKCLQSITHDLFYGCSSLTDVKIPDTVTYIASGAFENCTSLEKIDIPASTEEIERSAFLNCTSLKAITVASDNQYYYSDDNGVLYKKGANYNYNYDEIIQYPAGNTSKTYHIPTNAKIVFGDPFRFCKNLTSISVDDEHTEYACDENGVLYTKNMKALLWYPLGKSEIEYTVSPTVESISTYAFEGCRTLKTVIISGSLRSVGTGAFAGCTKLRKVVFQGDVNSISHNAFRGCTSLYGFKLPYGIERIETGTFADSNIKILYIPASVTRIDKDVLSECKNLDTIVYEGTKRMWDDVIIYDGHNINCKIIFLM